MIPILYDTIYTESQKTKIAYLGNLVSCIVSEERNGIYELNAEMPNGVYPWEEIKAGRVIEAQASQTNGIQAFRIDEVNTGIDGNMQIHANHISYDLLYHTVDPSVVITSTNAQGVMQSLLNQAHRYSSDATWTAYADFWTTHTFTFNGTKSIRKALGGSEGSVLDVFGGEFEFDNFTVKLLNARGSANPTPIYYGSNLISFDKKILDDSYTDVQAFVTIEDSTVTSSVYRINGYDSSQQTKIYLMDWSDKYEQLPTQANLNSAVSAYASVGRNKSKTSSYEVQFVPLIGDISLCDTVTAHGRNGESFEAKISRTDWNVLKDRYETITIGDLPTSLAQTISDTASHTTVNIYSGGGGEVVEAPITKIQKNGTDLPINNKTVNITVPTKTSDLTNDSGYISGATVVTSVNGQTGDVTISVPTKTSDLTNDSGYLTSVPVTSVNTKTGAVVLTASDVNALPSNTTYVKSINGQSGTVVLSIPTVPTNVSAFTNDAGYATETYVDTAISEITPSGEANVIETVKVNGDALTVTDKTVDVKVPVRSAYSTTTMIDGDDGYSANMVFLGIKRLLPPQNTSYVTESVYVPKVIVSNGKIGIDSRLLSDYYTKSEIDTKIGDIETLLASI